MFGSFFRKKSTSPRARTISANRGYRKAHSLRPKAYVKSGRTLSSTRFRSRAGGSRYGKTY